MIDPLIPSQEWAEKEMLYLFHQPICPTCSVVVGDRLLHRAWHIAMVQLSEKREDIVDDPRWNRPCSLMGCSQRTGAHHHHLEAGHLSTFPCDCTTHTGQPGTRLPRET